MLGRGGGQWTGNATATVLTDGGFWFYQDFAAGSGPNLTLTDNDNGTGGAAWDSSNIQNSSAQITTTGGAPIYTSTAQKDSTTRVSASAHTGASVTLSGTPAAGEGTIRVWYKYTVDAANAPDSLLLAPKFLTDEEMDLLDRVYLEQDKNLSDVGSATTSFDNISPTTTKGDLIVDNGSNDVRFPVGTDTYFLVADSAQTEGVAWQNPGSYDINNFQGDLSIANGGTGQSTASAAFDALSPLTTNGDILYYNSGNQRLAKGTDGQILTLSSGIPSWAAAGASTLQDAYDNSADGTITLDNTRNGVRVEDNGTPIGATLFDVVDNGASNIFFSVDVNGIQSTSHIILNQGNLELREDSGNGTNYIRHQAAASIGSSYTLTWPNAVATADSYLESDNAGTLSWTAKKTINKGSSPVPSNFREKTITYGTAFSDTNYRLMVQLENTVDAEPQIFSHIITNKTTGGFTVMLSADTLNANTVVSYYAEED